MKNILHNSKFRFTKWCVGLRVSLLLALTVGWMGAAQGQTTIVGWDFNGLSAYGPSPLAPSTADANVTATGLTRSVFTTTSTAAGNAWGGSGGNGSASFTVKANTGFALSLTQISAYNVRRSSSGSQTGQWAYSLDGTTFVNIGSQITWGSNTSSPGNLQSTIDLSGISELQNLPATTTVTFRVTTGGASGTGTWYLNHFQTGDDFVVTGTVSAAETAPTVSSSAATSISATGATLNGNVTSDGGSAVTERGFVYKTSAGVTIDDNKTVVSGTTGAFSTNITSLTTGATYYFRAYASNSVGVTLSTEQSFTTGAVAPPALTSAVVATVDTAFDVTFPDDATWRGAINGVTVDGVPLTGGFAVSSGKITFTPSASVPTGALQTPGTKAIVITAGGYNNATASQIVGAGQASKLVITTQPVAPAVNPGTFATQPVVALQDQYSNATASTAEVTAAVGAGTWTLGGTATVAAVNGTATFAGLTASSASAVTGATISFSSGSLEAVSSAAFNLAAANELQLAAVGTAVTQNFDSLASTGNSSLMPLGWFFVETGTAANTTYAAGTGSSNAANTYSFGADGLTERALGGLQSGSLVPVFGAKIRNTTGSTLTDLSISYVGERWRLGATGREDRLDFEYSTDAASLSDGTWTAVPTLNFTAPSSSGPTGPLNGDDEANRVTVTGTVQNLSLANGAALWIRWVDFNASGADDGLGIDDFSVTGSVNAVAAPQFALAGGEYLSDQVVKIANFAALTTAGAIIYYTVDGSTPTASSTPYNDTSGVALTAGNGSITVQAVAIKGADVSSVASATYHLPKDVADLTALRASPTGTTIYRVTGEVTYTAGTSFRNTKFFQDAGAGIQIDDASRIVTTNYAAGDNVAGIIGRISFFNGQLQMVPLQDFGAAVSSGNAVTPLSRTLSSLTDADQARLVTIPGVEYQGANGTLVFTTNNPTINIPIRDSSTGTNYSGYCRNVFGNSDVTGKVVPTNAVTLNGIVQKTVINSVQTLTVGPRNSVEAGLPSSLSLIWSVDLEIGESDIYFDPEFQYLTLSRVGKSTGELQVLISCNPESRLSLQNGGVLPQTITILDGEASTQVKLMPVDNSTYTGDTLVTITAAAANHTSATASATILEDDLPDTVKPVITLIGDNPLLLANGATYTDPGAKVTDNVDAERTITGSGTVNTAVQGDYTVTYNANDAAGNVADAVTRTVRVAAPVVVESTYAEWSGGAALDSAGLAKYAIGGASSLTANDGAKPTTALTGGFLVITAIVRTDNSDLTVVGQAVTDMANYAIGTGVTTVNGVETTDQKDVPTGHKRKTFSVAQGSDARKFMRLSASLVLSGVNTTVTVAKDSGGATFLQVTGATAGATGGGTATSDKRSIYYYAPDTTSSPTFSGGFWPYVIVQGQLSAGAGVTATLTKNGSGMLLVNGLPAYQYGGDSGSTTASGVSGAWPAMRADGTKTTTGPSGTLQ